MVLITFAPLVAFFSIKKKSCCLLFLNDINFHAFFDLQRHDIIKKRIDAHGNVIEARQDGIGAPKVGNKIFLEFSSLWTKSFIYLWRRDAA